MTGGENDLLFETALCPDPLWYTQREHSVLCSYRGYFALPPFSLDFVF
jgi:hypothetical protein